MTGRNVFENNNQIADEDVEVLGDGPHIPLPELKEGFHYEITDLPSGRKAVTVQTGEESSHYGALRPKGGYPWGEGAEVLKKRAEESAEDRSCGCGPFQGCATCGRYQGDGLNSPESRTLRHQD